MTLALGLELLESDALVIEPAIPGAHAAAIGAARIATPAAT